MQAAGNAFMRTVHRLSHRKRRRRRELPSLDQTPELPDLNHSHSISQNHQQRSVVQRSMDRLRRSLRLPRRHRSPERQTPPELANSSAGKQEMWAPDEASVKAGLCSFNVKYLGSVEVFESRGMQVCEGALKALRNSRRKPVKALLYVSGDGLRVVDQEHNRGLIVDQTIEKVSFCAPDRNNDKGFAYICRDGTSRRWMCHGFHATKESGERLSHAVGCAFAICLERKKKRDEESSSAAPPTAETALNPNWGDSNSTHDDTPSSSTPNNQPLTRTNLGYQSFRKQISITERLQDPQSAILTSAPSASQQLPSGIAKPRPAANPSLFQRQGSLRAPESSSTSNFRRNYSLRTDALSSSSSPKRYGNMMHSEPIYEGDEDGQQHANDLVHIEQLPHAITPSTTYSLHSPNHQYSNLTNTSSTAMTPENLINLQSPETTVPPPSSQHFDPFVQEVQNNSPLNNGHLQNIDVSKSKADAWLDDVFRQSLTLSSPPPSATTAPSSSTIFSPNNSTMATSTSSSSWSSNMAQQQQQLQRPQTIATTNGGWNNQRLLSLQSPQTPADLMIFDSPLNATTALPPPSQIQQPVNAPPPIPVKAAISNGSVLTSNGLNTQGHKQQQGNDGVEWEANRAVEIPKPVDPFDIMWSSQVAVRQATANGTQAN